MPIKLLKKRFVCNFNFVDVGLSAIVGFGRTVQNVNFMLINPLLSSCSTNICFQHYMAKGHVLY
jgi:large-conductance mechanosensitive channel